MLPTYVATKHTTNELLFDTYVKTNYLMDAIGHGILLSASYMVYFSIIISMSIIVICMDMSC